MKSPFRTVLIFITVCLCGLLCVPHLNINLYPQPEFKSLFVSYDVGNQLPSKVEEEITSKLENILSGLNDLKKVTSTSSFHKAQVELQFNKDANIENSRFEVVSLLRQIRNDLPADVGFPNISQENSGNKDEEPVIIYTIHTRNNDTLPEDKLNEVFRKPLSQIRGVKDIIISGGRSLQVNIFFDILKLNNYHIKLSELINEIKQVSSTVYPGSVTLNQNKLFIKVLPTDKLQELLQLPIPGTHDGIKLRDVADVKISEAAEEQLFRINGKNALRLQVFPQKGVNTVALAKTIKTTVKDLLTQNGSYFSFFLTYDSSEFLRLEIAKNLQRTIFALFILTVFIFIAYRDWRHLLNLLLTLGVNLILTIMAVWFFGIPIHLYSLAGIAIAFGIMIDHGIIMLDYYRQFQNRKVFMALMAATFTTIAALLVVFLLPDEEKKNLSDFVIIICIALGTSLVTNLFFTIAMHDLLFAGATRGAVSVKFRSAKKSFMLYSRYFSLIKFLSGYKKVLIISVILLFGIPIFLLPDRIEGNNWYNRTLGSTLYTEQIRPITDKVLGGTFRVFKKNIIENSEYRDFGETKLFIYLELPLGSSPSQMNSVINDLENYLGGFKSVEKFITNIYSGRSGKIEVSFSRKYQNGSFPYWLKAQLIAKAENLGGVTWNIFGIGQGYTMGAGEENPKFKVKLKGYNYDKLEKETSTLAKQLSAYPRVQKINTDAIIDYDEKSGEEFHLTLNDGKFNNSGIMLGDLSNELQARSNAGINCCSLYINGNLLPVVFKERLAENYNKFDFLNSYTSNQHASGLRLKNYANIQLQKTSGTIIKEDRQYVRMLGFEYSGTEQYGSKYLNKELKQLRRELPFGYSAVQEMNNWSWKENSGHYFLIIILLFGIFCIAAILFENLYQSIVISLTIPVSFIGIFLIYGLGNFYFDQGGYASFIMVGGLIANAGIFIINDINNLPKRISANKKVIKATFNRSRTIFLTTVASICGVLPFIIEGQKEVFWFSFAIGAIGGLIFSLFAVFILLPVMLFANRN